MFITFLIGNGYDLNLGLNTRYSDFISYYKDNRENDSDIIREFKNQICKNELLWSQGELAFGEYTKQFEGENAGIDFCRCHTDFCIELANYLRQEQKRIRYTNIHEARKALSAALCGFVNLFREEESEQIKKSMNSYGDGFIFNVVNFNYTNTIDLILRSVNEYNVLGTRTHGGMSYINKIGNIYHVHGTVEKNMALGLDNESQIKNSIIFSNIGDEYRNEIIKKETNEANRENMDNKVHGLIKTANLIYIYGMSIGETDAIWWDRICKAMQNDQNLHLIIYAHDAPKETLIRREYQTFEKEKIREFLHYGRIDYNNAGITKRIHLQRDNIFELLTKTVSLEELEKA